MGPFRHNSHFNKSTLIAFTTPAPDSIYYGHSTATSRNTSTVFLRSEIGLIFGVVNNSFPREKIIPLFDVIFNSKLL